MEIINELNSIKCNCGGQYYPIEPEDSETHIMKHRCSTCRREIYLSVKLIIPVNIFKERILI